MRKNILKVFISLVIIIVAICFKSIEVERNVESQRFLEEISVIEKNQNIEEGDFKEKFKIVYTKETKFNNPSFYRSRI